MIAIFTTEGLTGGSNLKPFNPKLNAFNHSATDPCLYANMESVGIYGKIVGVVCEI